MSSEQHTKRTETRSPGIALLPLAKLRPAAWNPRLIRDERFRNLCASIEADPDFLWRRPILAQADGTIYAGNMRYRAAEHLGMDAVPAIMEDIPDRLAKERALRDNAQWGEWVDADLTELLRSMAEDGSDMSLLGFDDDDLHNLLGDEATDGLTDPDDVPPLPKTPVTQPGDLWLLGPHRLLCGDSTRTADVERLMASEIASLMVTDPPYGVGYRAGAKGGRRAAIANDNLGKDQARFWASAFVHWPLAGDAYVFSPSGPLITTLCAAIETTGINHHQWLIWVKQQLVLGRSHYHYRHEHIFYGWKGKSSWRGSRSEDSVWEAERPLSSVEHPTMKPVTLCERAIKNSSRANDLVVDPFLGSGTTLIAAERLGRRCHAMELEAAYVDVAVDRWQAHTGGKAVRNG